jgi:hypothetical protein
MTDLPDGAQPGPAETPRVLILDLDFGPSAYPEDGITLLERWANSDPSNTPALGAISKTTATVRLPFLFG